MPYKISINEIIYKYSDMVYRLAISRTRNKADAEDVFQEVFFRLAKKMPEFESEEHTKAWLIRVTINCSNNIFNSSWFKNTVNLEDEIKFEEKEEHDIYYAVMNLPLKYRTIIYLFYYEEYKVKEISKLLKINESTVKTRLSRAREKLKNKIGEEVI